MEVFKVANLSSPSHDFHCTWFHHCTFRFRPFALLLITFLEYTTPCFANRLSLSLPAAFLTLSVHSLPSPPLDMGLKVIRQYEAEGGNITRYKDQSPAKRSFDTVDLSRPQCGSGNLTCSSQNTFAAYQSDCAGLLSVLSGQQPRNGTVKRDTNYVCYSTGNRYSPQCCISMMQPISNAVDGDYLNFAITLYNQCGDAKSGKVAGVISYTTINSECNNVCLIGNLVGDYDDCAFLILPHWK